MAAPRRLALQIIVQVAALVVALVWHPSARAAPPEADPSAVALGSEQRSPEELDVGRWHGRVVERHPEFVRYAFEAPGEASVIVELSPRRPDHTQPFGTPSVVVQPAPGAEVDPELLEAVGAWLRDSEEAAQASFGVVGKAGASPAREPGRALRGIGVGLLGLWLLGLVASAIAGRREREASPTSEARARALALGAAVLVTIAVAVLRLGFGAPTTLADDALRDLGSARGCLEIDCRGGAKTSFGGLAQGTGFPRLIGLGLMLGHDIEGAQILIALLFALAVGVSFDAGRRLGERLGPDLGPGFALLLGALAAASELALLLTELAQTGEILWNPAAVALPAALTQAALLRGAATGRATPLLLAAAFAGLTFEAHVAGLALWPAVLLTTLAVVDAPEPAPRSARALPPLALVAALAGVVAIPMLLSPDSVAIDAGALVSLLGWLGLAAAAIAGLGLGLGLRRWVRGQAPTSRARACVVAIAAPPLILLASLFVSADFVLAWPVRYFAPAFPGFALALAALVGLGLRRLGDARVRAITCAAVVLALLAASVPAYAARMAVERGRWNYADMRTIAGILRERDVHVDQLHLAIRGGLCGPDTHGDRGQPFLELVIAGLRLVGELDPTPSDPEARPPTWFVAKVERATFEQVSAQLDDPIVFDAGDDHAIVMIAYDPVLDLRAVEHCVRSAEGDACVLATPRPPNPAGREILPRHDLPETETTPASSEYRLPLHPTEVPREVAIWTLSPTERPPWRFVDAEDRNTSPLPSDRVELHLEPGAPPTVILAYDFEQDPQAQGKPWRGFWPPLIEVTPSLRPLLDQLARSSAPQ